MATRPGRRHRKGLPSRSCQLTSSSRRTRQQDADAADRHRHADGGIPLAVGAANDGLAKPRSLPTGGTL
jgi:hypothetical protein